MVVVAAIPLVAIALDRLRRDRQWIAGFLLTVGVVLQPFYRFDMGPVGVGQARPSSWRIPTQVSAMQIPDWYQELDPQGWEGIIELPLEQQQDLLCTYQTVHHRKVYRSWATMSAIPDWIRHSGGGDAGRRLRWLAKEPPQRDGMENLFRDLSRDPSSADFGSFENIHLNRLMDSGGYRWLIIHERGFYLLNPNEGDLKYREVVRKMSERLGMVSNEVVEQKSFEWPGKTRHFPVGPAWIPWASQEVQRPTIDVPDRYFMSVFDLHEWEGRGETD